MFGVVDDTTTTKFTSRACAVHCNSLPVVVDKAVVVVLKFPNASSSIKTANFARCHVSRSPASSPGKSPGDEVGKARINRVNKSSQNLIHMEKIKIIKENDFRVITKTYLVQYMCGQSAKTAGHAH